MRSILLIVAIFLATAMNGVLLYELPLFGKSLGNEIAINARMSEMPKINVNIGQQTPKQESVQPDIYQSQPNIYQIDTYVVRPYHYTRWAYRPFQPVRNVVRFFHNQHVRLHHRYCWELPPCM